MKKFLNYTGIIFSYIFMTINIIFIGLLTILLITNGYFSKVNVSRIVSDINVYKLLEESSKERFDKIKSISNELNINEYEMEEILNSEGIKDYASSYISSLYGYIIFDKELYSIDKEELLNIVSKAIDSINNNQDSNINNETKGAILDYVDIHSEEIINLFPNEEKVKEYSINDSQIKVIRNILSIKSIFILALIIFVILVIIGLLRFSYYKWSYYFGLSLSICGFIYLSGFILYDKLKEEIIYGDGLSKYLGDILFGNLSSNLFIASIILFILGILMFIMHNYFRNNLVKKEEI